MFRWIRASLFLATCIAIVPAAFASEAADVQRDTALVQHPEIVVSATRTQKNQLDVPNGTVVITRDEMRKRNIRTLAEALQDVVGLDTGEGSDNGSGVPNVGMWGLKEFDALLFTLNGVPVGGPFNPSLTQIQVDDLDRIEIVKGPQGTMYGVSAFAGMIQAFTPETEAGTGSFTLSGGSFGTGNAAFGWGKSLKEGRTLRLNGTYGTSDGWQDRTGSAVGRGNATIGWGLGRGHLAVDLFGYSHQQDWGSPLPYDNGAPVPGFVIDRNYAVIGAEVRHDVFGATSRFTWPMGDQRRIENTLSYLHDKQKYLRSFPGAITGDNLESEGLELHPTETSLYEDARFVTNFDARGSHEMVAGASLTWGETKGPVREFDFDQSISGYPNMPTLDNVTVLDERDFEDGRTFFGAYVHDSWTPMPRLTLGGGGRFDAVSEELETEADLPGGPQQVKDKREDTDFSGDVTALFRLIPEGIGGALEVANLYGSFRRAFKPAAPNLAEAEEAEILEPEHTTSWEAGLKARANATLSFDVAYFDMTFENMVTSILGPGGLPELVNAGEQRFRGVETGLHWSPMALRGVTFDLGYAHHDAKFVNFTFVTPDGEFRDVSGNHLELVAPNLVNGRVSLHHDSGLGVFVAGRWQDERPFNRRNTVYDKAFSEWDAGLSYDRNVWRVGVVGRNLGDDRHVTTESEIGDAQFYPAAPRRFTAEIGRRF